MWRATFKSLLAKKLRLVLTAVSVVLGVGFVAGTYVLTDTMNAAFDQLFAQTSEASDVVVRSVSAFDSTVTDGGGGGGGQERKPLPESLLGDVTAVPGVAAAAGDVQGYAQMVDPATDEVIGGVGPPTIGTNWNELADQVLDIREGSPPTGPDDVVIDAATASSSTLAVGDRISILFQGPPREFTISGIAGFGEADNLGGATLAVFDTETAQDVLGKEGVYDAISVVAEEGVSATQLRASIAQVLPERVEAVTSTSVADEQSEALQEGLGFFRTALLVFAFVALFVGSFIIFNTFSIIVAQRTRELALLRALGASRRQVVVSVVLEAFVVGLVASVLGILAGIGIALGLQGLLGLFNIDLPSTALQLLPRTIVVSMVVGVGVTVAASILPARRAGTVAPIQAMREADDAPPPRSLAGRRLAVAVARHGARGGGAPVRLVRSGVQRRLDRRPGSGGDVHRGRDAVAARGQADRGRHRGTVATVVRAGPARARERDAEPAADRFHGRRPHDRSRARLDGRDPRRFPEGVVRRCAHRDLEGRLHAVDQLVHRVQPGRGRASRGAAGGRNGLAVPPERLPRRRQRRRS